MSSAQLDLILKHIRRVAGAPGTGEGSDQRLLENFLGRRDEAAFAELVKRHGPMVLNVCRGVLHHEQDAEDAFQATFLVLAQKADSIRHRETVAGWLWGVANHLSKKAQAMAARQRRDMQRETEKSAPDPLLDMTVRDLRRALYEELQRLPEKYRLPLVLCYLEGRTQEEAAQQLGWSKGAFRGRLNRGREKLRARLARRGLTLSAGMLTTALAVNPASAAVPALLLDSTAKAALAFACGNAGPSGLVSATVVSLAAEAVKAMVVPKLKIVTAFIVAVGMLGLGVGTMTHRLLAERQEGTTRKVGKVPRNLLARADDKPSGAAPASKEEEKKQMTVTGRVFDADGKPAGNADVAMLGGSKRPHRGGDFSAEEPQVLGHAKTDAEGRFQLKVARTSSTVLEEVLILARGGDNGLGWQELILVAKQPVAEIHLPSEQIIRGKLVDLQGQPAKGIRVQVWSIGQSSPGQFKGVNMWEGKKDLPPWPKPGTTDEQGRFVIRGVGRDLTVSLLINDERFARQTFFIQQNGKGVAEDLSRSLEPAHIIEGLVTYADTGKPVPNARLTVYASDQEGGGGFGIGAQADEKGRFHVNPAPGSYFQVNAYAPDGEPYMTLSKSVKWPRAVVKQEVQLALPRGVLVRGKITEGQSGKPVADASIQFIPRYANNPNRREDVLTGWQNIVLSGADGTFSIAVLPGPGNLLIHGPTSDYVLQDFGENRLYDGGHGGRRNYVHGLVELDLAAKSRTHEVAVTLRKGVTVKGNLVGPDGKPVAEALMLSRLQVSPLHLQWRGFPVQVRDGRFKLQGLDPDKTYHVYFLDPKNKLGATVELSGKQIADSVKVQLAPCGSAAVRFLNAEGKPIVNRHPALEIVVTPGHHFFDVKSSEQGKLAADADFVANFDRLNYWDRPKTDSQGRVTLSALIPGATYRIIFASMMNFENPKEFTVESGKTTDLGDITFKEEK
jgi:RNA polymerase sigma factor (sigma-70 family)